MKKSISETLCSEKFITLLNARRNIRLAMSLLLFANYAFFIGGLSIFSDWFAQPISADSVIPIGIPATIIVLVNMVVLQYLYTEISERYLDKLQVTAKKELIQ